MKYRKPLYLLFALLAVVGIATSCSKDDDSGSSHGTPRAATTLFVATDRHEAGQGNHLTAMLQRAVADLGLRPQTVLLGGDYVGGGRDREPAFSITDLYDEVFAVLDPLETRFMATYGSHDNGCTEGFAPFFSGPRRCDGFYTYGVSYIQMVFATDSAAQAAILYYQEHGEDTTGVPAPPTADRDSTMRPPDGDTLSRPADSGSRPPMPMGGGMRGYNGIDQADRYGLSAESATRSFLAWAATLPDRDPIVVMTHVPLHAHRGDNPGALAWFDAFAEASRTHDLIVLWGHNHTLEEHGADLDRHYYLLIAGDTLSVQGDSVSGVVPRVLDFTYANAGYLKLGFASTLTFADTRGTGHFDQLTLRRHSLDPSAPESLFGLTAKPNPYTIRLKQY